MLCCSASAWTETRVCISLRRAAYRCRQVSSRASRLSYTVRPDASRKRTAEPNPRSRDWRSRQPSGWHTCKKVLNSRGRGAQVVGTVSEQRARSANAGRHARGADGPVARPGGPRARDTGHRRWGVSMESSKRPGRTLSYPTAAKLTQRKRIVKLHALYTGHT